MKKLKQTMWVIVSGGNVVAIGNNRSWTIWNYCSDALGKNDAIWRWRKRVDGDRCVKVEVREV